MDSLMWLRTRHMRYIMITTCFFLDIINIYWFSKLFRGARVVCAANWKYYEKYHMARQIESICSYPLLFKSKVHRWYKTAFRFALNRVRYLGFSDRYTKHIEKL